MNAQQYALRLKDPRWKRFRAEYIERHTIELCPQCADCGEDAEKGSLHVHHRIYREGSEPWDYNDDDLLLLCEECHTYLHRTEQRVRALVISMRPHECQELNILLDELDRAKKHKLLKIGLAHAKQNVRDMVEEIESPHREAMRFFEVSP